MPQVRTHSKTVLVRLINLRRPLGVHLASAGGRIYIPVQLRDPHWVPSALLCDPDEEVKTLSGLASRFEMFIRTLYPRNLLDRPR